MPTNAKKIRIGGVSHDIEDTQARTDISALNSAISKYDSKNYLPTNYMGKGPFLAITNSPYIDQSIYTEKYATKDGVTINAIDLSLTAGTYAFLNYVVPTKQPDYAVRGDYNLGIDIMFADAVSSMFIAVYVGNGVTFSKTISASADTWYHIEIPFTISSTNNSIQIRLLSNTTTTATFANVKMAYGNVSFVEPLEELYGKNDIVEMTDAVLQPQGNLWDGGYTVEGYYINYGDLSRTAATGWAISDKIYVVGGEKYTFNQHHTVVAYDKYDRPVGIWRNTDFDTTVTLPLSAYYLICNINTSWTSFVVNKGESVTDTDNAKYDGAFIVDGTVTADKLDPNIDLGIEDGSITLAKLNASLVSYLLNGTNLQSLSVGTNALANASVDSTKLASEVYAHTDNGANLDDGSVPLSALSQTVKDYIDSSGSGTITNLPDDSTIKSNGSNELYVNTDAFNVVFVNSDVAFADLISTIGAISGKVILCLKANVTIASTNVTMPSNLFMVVGMGGIFTASNLSTSWYINFPDGCQFVCGKYQLFDKYIYAFCQGDGRFLGEAIPQWWGAVGDGVTDDSIPILSMMVSRFKTVRFPQGVYVAYPSNAVSGRTIIMDEGAIIDGVFHVAYGSNAGAETKKWCENVNVVGKMVSTVRVGGAQADGVNMPDGIHILGTNANYVNQSTEGGPKGVHWHFGCKNLNIGEIVVDEIRQLSSGYSYALGIDGYTGEENPSNIYIKSVKAGANSSDTFDVLLSGVTNVVIDDINVESGSSITYSLSIGYCDNVKIGRFRTKASNNAGAKAGVLISSSTSVYVDSVEILPNVSSALAMWGYWVNNSSNVFTNNVHTKYMAQGLRFVNSSSVYVGSHITDHDTAQKGDSGSTYKINNTFTIS